MIEGISALIEHSNNTPEDLMLPGVNNHQY